MTRALLAPSLTLRYLPAARPTTPVMFQSFKLWKLAADVKRPGNDPEAYSAVAELGRVGGAKAVDLLLVALARRDGVSRCAARELGRLRDARALKPLADALADAGLQQSAAEALLAHGPAAVDTLLGVLTAAPAPARRLAAATLGDLGDRRAVEPLVNVLQTDDDYAVRTAAATALGQLKDPRAVWALVGTLKMRDETAPDRQALLEKLRQATSLALHKIGDPLSGKPATVLDTAEAAVAQVEQAITESNVHPRLLGDPKLLSETELVGVLRDLVGASEEISWAKLESREPALPAWFRTYDQRADVARVVGEELHRRGGPALLHQILERDLAGHAAIRNWWEGMVA